MLKSGLHTGFPAYPKDIPLDAWYPSMPYCSIYAISIDKILSH